MKKIIIVITAVLFLMACTDKSKTEKANIATCSVTEIQEYKNAEVSDGANMDVQHDKAPAIRSTIKFEPPVITSDDDEDVPNIDVSKINKKKIIKDGDIFIKANDIEKSKKDIDALLKNFNAYYDNEDFQNNSDKIAYELQLRIPSDNFEKLLSCLENGKDEITAKNIRARDVTEEYVDLSSRLNNKKLYLKKYTELLNRATTVKDIIAIQENIRNLQEELESTEGRLKYLSDQVSYSSLTIHLYKEKEYTYKPEKQHSFLERLKASLNNGWSRGVDFILVLIQNWALLILLIASFILIRRYIKRRKEKTKV